MNTWERPSVHQPQFTAADWLYLAAAFTAIVVFMLLATPQ